MKMTNKERKVLIVDDDPQVLKIIRKCLDLEEYQSKTAISAKEALTLLHQWNPHLVLLDISMPDSNGLEILKVLRKKEEYVSTIFLSGHSEVNDIIKGLDSGADDYICKPFDLKELLARIRSQFRIKDLQDKLKKTNEKLKKLAHTDDLTGLYNMRSLYDRLDYELLRARRFKKSVAVLMLDMDYFKSVNDKNDHLFGSHVLSEVGNILKKNIRAVDFAARYGGDEFLVILTEVNLKGAFSFANRIRRIIKAKPFFDGDSNQELNVDTSQKLTVSIGVSFFNHKDKNVDARQLVRLADHALYEAKEKGRNCVRLRFSNSKVAKGA